MDILTDLIASAELQDALITIIGLVLTILIRRGAAMLEVATGIRIEESARTALHSAIQSGVVVAIEKGPEAGFDEIRRQAIDYARRSVPDAIAALVPGDGVLDDLALRYYREVMERAGVGGPGNVGL